MLRGPAVAPFNRRRILGVLRETEREKERERGRGSYLLSVSVMEPLNKMICVSARDRLSVQTPRAERRKLRSGWPLEWPKARP